MFTTTRLVVLTLPQRSESSIASVAIHAMLGPCACKTRVARLCSVKISYRFSSKNVRFWTRWLFFLRGVRGALMSVVDWQRGIQDEIHDGTFPPSRPLLARSLVFFPSLNLLYRKFRNKMEQGRESDR